MDITQNAGTDTFVGEIAIGVSAYIAKYRATQNPIFLWEAVGLLTDSRLEGASLVLPTELRKYLNEASEKIRHAAVCRPKEFRKSALLALGFSERQGSSPVKDYARDQSIGVLLGIYEELKQRHGSSEAERIMANTLNLDPKSMRGRFTAARKTMKAMRDEAETLGMTAAPLSRDWAGLPEVLLLNILRGLPDLVWTKDGTRLHGSKRAQL